MGRKKSRGTKGKEKTVVIIVMTSSWSRDLVKE